MEEGQGASTTYYDDGRGTWTIYGQRERSLLVGLAFFFLHVVRQNPEAPGDGVYSHFLPMGSDGGVEGWVTKLPISPLSHFGSFHSAGWSTKT